MAYETAKQQHQMHETGGPSGGGGGRGGEGAGVPANVADPSTLLLPERSGNPLLCAVCRDYFREPRLLQCYHTFCARCVRGRVDATQQITCPLCGQMTQLRESPLPPPDLLIEQLIELANSENPPCSNCDVRDKPNMYYCNTCGQALCHHCRENTHRAKMFSTHEVVHASKCAKEPKKCPIHGEQYIMFSSAQKTMLCVNCFRDTAAEQRSFCVDIDSAYAAAVKRLDRAQGGINELQNSIRDGLIMFKNLLDELRQNMESEKHTINTFCQGMQEAIAKTHANMIMEVQRQFETKEKVFRGQLVTLGAVLPTLQLHLMLCAAFANAANKFQFLELAYLMFDRLNTVSQLSHPLRPVQSSTIRTNYRNEFAQSLEPWVGKSVLNPIESSTGNIYESSSIPMIGGQPGVGGATGAPAGTTPAGGPFAHPTKRQQSALKTKLLEDETPFSTHCRAFETQIKELCQQVTGVKERLGELHRDVTILRRDNMPPLNVRFECVARDCSLLDESLERHQTELDRMKIIFDALWQEQLCRIHVEQEIFHSQITDIATLRNELHHLSAAAHHLEPFVRNTLDVDGGGGGGAIRESNTAAHQHLQSLLEQIGLLQLENLQLKTECKLHPAGASTQAIDLKGGDTIPVKETPKAKSRTGVDVQQQRVQTGEQQTSTGSGVVATAATTTTTEQQKRNVISQLIEKVNRKKSPTDDTRTHAHCSSSGCIKDRERSKSTGSVGPPAATSAGGTSKDAKTGGLKQAQKVASSALAQPTATIERLETHIKEKIHDIMNRRQSKSIFEMVSQDSTVSLPGQSSTKMKSATLPLNISDDQKCPKSIEIQMDSAMQQEFASLVHRKLSRSDLDKLALLSQTTRVAPLESKKIGKSCDKINEMKTLKMQTHPHHHVGSIADGISMQKIIGHARRSKTPESAQRYRSKTPPEIGSGVQGAPSSARRSKSGEGSCDKSRSRSKTPPERRSARSHESDYQHIADATTVVMTRSDKGKYKQNRSTPSSPKGTSGGTSSGTSSRKHKVYPFSDGEDAAEFYRRQRRSGGGDRSGDSSRGASRENVASSKGNLETKGARQNSFESLSTLSFNSRRSSLENADKTLVLVIGARGNKQSTSGGSNKSLNKQTSGGSGSRRGSKKGSDRSASDFSSKQRSWETFPPKKHRNNNGVRSYHYCHFATAERTETRQKVRAAAAAAAAGSTGATATTTSVDKQPGGAATPTGPKKRTATAAVAPFVAPPPPATERGGKMVAGTTFMTIGGPRMGHKRHAGHRQQHVVAERGYFSEYELDFDTDDPNDDDDVQDSVFDFDDELNLTFDHRARTAGRPRTSDFRRTGHMSTFKGNEMSTPYQPGHLSTFKSDSSHALMSTFKGGDASSGPFKSEPYPTPGHMSTFKGDVIAGAPPPSSSSQQQHQQQQPHFTTFKGDAPAPFSTFKGGDGASAQGGAFKPCFQGYFKGESSQSLSPGSGESSGQSDGTLKKADSFEGHEEAVRTLVAAVQETRTAAARKSK